MELLCCGRTHITTQTTVTQKCQRPENPQHNNLRLLCCGFSGRWPLWATVRLYPCSPQYSLPSVTSWNPSCHELFPTAACDAPARRMMCRLHYRAADDSVPTLITDTRRRRAVRPDVISVLVIVRPLASRRRLSADSMDCRIVCSSPWKSPWSSEQQIYDPQPRAAIWRRGVVVSGVRRMNEVNARRARLVPGWVTVFGRVYHLRM